MKKFEYLAVVLNEWEMEEKLKKLGEEGWELVSVKKDMLAMSVNYGFTFIFKREKDQK